jgi:hypothetical protein
MVGRPKLPTMIAIDTSRSFRMRTEFEKSGTKRFTCSLVYLRIRARVRKSVSGSVPLVPIRKTSVTKTDAGQWRAVEFSSYCNVERPMSHGSSGV